MRSACVLLALAPIITASEAWVVPAVPDPVPIVGSGFVEADPDQVQTLTTDAVDARITWLGIDGRIVAPGDVLVELSTSRISERVGERRLQLNEAEAQFTLESLRQAAEISSLENEREDLRVRLTMVRAKIGALGADDATTATLAAATASEVEADAQAARRQAAASAALAAVGDIAREEARAAERTAERQAVTARRAETEARAAAQRERSAERERLAIEERELSARLGLGADGSEDPKRGIGGRLAAATSRSTGQRKNGAGERDARIRELHEAQRDERDRTPVSWIEVVRDGAPVLRCDMVAPEQEAASGWQMDRGALLAPGLSFGWDAVQVPVPGPKDGEPAAPGTIVVDGRARWSALLPDGPCTVRIGCGDAVDWSGALVRFPDGSAWTRNRLAAGIQICERSLTISGGRLDLDFGDGRPKALRAEVPAMVLLVPNMPVGNRVDNKTRPIVWTVDPGRMRLNVRLPQDLAALLTKPGERPVPRDPAGRTRHAMAISELRWQSGDGRSGSATVSSVVDKPVDARRTAWGWADSDANDLRGLIWREVHLVPKETLPLRSRLAAEVSGTATAPAGTAVLPAHLVASRPDGFLIQEFGQPPRRVPAVRAGERWVVLEGVTPGQRLVPPAGDAPVDPLRGPFPGEVIAGTSTPVVLSRAWGRIKTIVTDGSDVAAGAIIATLYNPNLEQNRERMTREKSRARQDARIAAENSRTRTIETSDNRRQRVDGERKARLDLDDIRRGDPVAATLAAQAADAADTEAVWTIGLKDRLETLLAPDPGQRSAAQSAAALAVVSGTRGELEAALAARSISLAGMSSAEESWRAAARALDLGDGDDRLARDDNQRNRLQARLRLREALRGGWFEREFNAIREVRAPVAGRIWLKNAWDEGRGRWARLVVDATVWQGVALAEIVDPLKPSFRAELPEALYPRLVEGSAVRLAFAHLGGLAVDGTVKLRSALIEISRDERSGEALRIGATRRVFTATITFQVPDGLGDAFDPGQTGTVELP